MTKFIDGPAQGQSLMLKRAPFFLRAVVKDDKWDALDQLDDEPETGEKIYVYQLVGKPGFCHINRGGGRGGFYPIAEYKLAELPPDESVVRNNDLWSAWCNLEGPLRIKA